MLFWDLNRLAQWDMVHHNDIKVAMEEFRLRLQHVSTNYHSGRHWDCHPDLDPAYIPNMKARQIIQWTRCPVQCTLEESLYQKTALARFMARRPPLPSKYIEVGTLCYLCGLDGHNGFHCIESSWFSSGR
ncbi:hypothetical protein BKA66DRAFT_471189 [Pyrenochaeta sp. MPI-SDFR-AT-0127]|nr:hypothetical protein BKA66DRAFT_471189 [Pyrenochaeta sp. MPI-SDFR-AT-0127]